MNGHSVNKKEFIALLSARIEELGQGHQKWLKKDIEFFIEQFFLVCTESLQKSHKLFFSSFGSFMVKDRKETVKTNPKDPSIKVVVPSKKVVRFKPSDKLNDLLN